MPELCGSKKEKSVHSNNNSTWFISVNISILNHFFTYNFSIIKKTQTNKNPTAEETQLKELH